MQGIPEGTAVQVEADRGRAIAAVVAAAQPADLVLIAGKGHEDYQILGTTKIHFDDREEAEKALRDRPC
jgi:UDP-N-acetylmuramoyl-L-alanyl-D-glutamate--2,6-diaminopimelate ligase